MGGIRTRIRKLTAQAAELDAAEREAKAATWLRGLSDADLDTLGRRQDALRADSGDPEAILTDAQMAEALGLTLAQLTAAIGRAGGTGS